LQKNKLILLEPKIITPIVVITQQKYT